MTYAVVDLRARTLTLPAPGIARWSTCPGRTPVAHAADAAAGRDGARPAVRRRATFSRLLEEVTLPLGRGDLFVLYTDGISEAMNVDGDCFGDARLADLASAARRPAVRRAARPHPRESRFTPSPDPRRTI